ncbi:RNA polymerase factor sigma-54 [Geomesophilobacter sediminis]|uniref:RNA polymerase factor sigma-54 n=1 Tax=Geomesophilobacter sediminis TaxID=2798584 RepID=A0A8J7JMK6_9BACT|nr:RNA polymerase factor sigma-54 [Geomesophilobacter sediminis]MBJ6725930.1 RNA polymerase factor sigma-54 [Geomesophilobacter sediminis]
MAIEMRQQMKMSQQLVMTPQLQQAIKLLQLSRLELQDVVRQELEENPILDEVPEQEEIREPEQIELSEKEAEPESAASDFQEVRAGEETRDTDWDSYIDGYNYSAGEQYYDDEERPSFENLLTKKSTLADHLLWQLSLVRFTEGEMAIGAEIIGNIDEDGYLRATVEDIATACVLVEPFRHQVLGEAGLTEKSAAAEITEASDRFADQVLKPQVLPVLKRIQEFDPVGVGARDLRECLLLQVESLGMGGTIVEALLRDHLKDLESRKYKQAAKVLGVEIADILAASKIIAELDPKPGRMFGQEDVQYISADIFVHKVGDDYVVLLNDDGMPNLRINPLYTNEAKVGRSLDKQAEEYIGDKMRSAMWLIKSIQQRQRTIFKVAKSLVKFQRDFLDRGIEYLRPLVLRDIAEDIGMHESTISRVTTNKYMQTPQGLFELKYFFNSGISTGEGDFIASESVKSKIKELVDAEDPKRPYSDQRLAELLSTHNIVIARRTVTKYREMLRIGSSSERKKHF